VVTTERGRGVVASPPSVLHTIHGSLFAASAIGFATSQSAMAVANAVNSQSCDGRVAISAVMI
jgi:hypothetical protein